MSPIVIHLPIRQHRLALNEKRRFSRKARETGCRDNARPFTRPSGLCPRFAGTSALPVSRVSPVMRSLQPHGCWRTVNKADHFAACNFYLFLRTYVSLMAGPLITVRATLEYRSGSSSGGRVDAPGSATETSELPNPITTVIHAASVGRRFSLPGSFFRPPPPGTGKARPLIEARMASIKRDDFYPPVKAETSVSRRKRGDDVKAVEIRCIVPRSGKKGCVDNKILQPGSFVSRNNRIRERSLRAANKNWKLAFFSARERPVG